METLTTEQEQIEDLKKWWMENGKSLIAIFVLGIGDAYRYLPSVSTVAMSIFQPADFAGCRLCVVLLRFCRGSNPVFDRLTKLSGAITAVHLHQ